MSTSTKPILLIIQFVLYFYIEKYRINRRLVGIFFAD